MKVAPLLGSVLIPAQNEAAVIAACLEPLAAAAAAGVLEVIVVCNGCRDTTAEIARAVTGVQVLELPVGGKTAALRAGELALTALPRIYLDADVVLPLEAALAVLRRLTADRPAPLAARPPVRYDTAGCDRLVRRYYRARAGIPAVLGSLWGAGVFAVSAAGRARFAEFPHMVAEDLWIDQLFEPHEIEVVACPPVAVSAPRRAADLLRVLSRTYRGKAEHHRLHPDQARETAPDTRHDLGRLARTSWSAALDAVVYLGFAVTARLAYRARRGERWERDESTRQPQAAAGRATTSTGAPG